MLCFRDFRIATRFTTTIGRGATGLVPGLPAARLLGMALGVALLATLLAPLAGYPLGAVAAQDIDPIATEEPTPAAQVDGEPDDPDPIGEGDGGDNLTPDETPVADQTPVGEETPVAEPTAVPQDPNTSNIAIYIYMYGCDSDYGGDPAKLYEHCEQVSDFAFDVYRDGALHHSAQGFYTAQGLPAGQYTIREYLLQGYGQPLVFCRVDPREPDLIRVAVDIDSYGAAVGTDETLYCDSYHVKQGEGTIRITNRFCPAGVEVSNPDVAVLTQACQDIKFSGFALFDTALDDLGSGPTDLATGKIAFEHIPAGQVFVSQGPILGYVVLPIVFCDRYTADGQNTGYQLQTVLTEVETRGGVSAYFIDTTLNDLDILDCSWFNIPESESGRLSVYKYVCPEDAEIDYYALSADELGERCAPYAGDEVAFDLYDAASGETQTRFTDPDPSNGGPAGARWDQLPVGLVTVTEHAWDGYGKPRVFCGVATEGGVEHSEASVDGWTANVTIEADLTVLCYWYNIPKADHGEVWITKYVCPEDGGFDYYAADVETLPDRCEIYTGSDIGFDFSSHATGSTTTRYGDPAFEGSIWWDKVPVGLTTVTEHAQEGYGRPVVSCGYSIGSSYDPFPVEVDGRSVDFEVRSYVETEQSVACSWFNIPTDEYGSVTVVKYACPDIAGYEPAGVEWYQRTCPEPAEGVTFKLDGESSGNPGEQETDADGVVTWDEREADHYYLYEDAPAGYGRPVVFCDAYYPLDEQPPDWDEFDPSSTPDADPFDYRVEFGLSEGQSILCYWFNVPDDGYDAEPGTLTIVKYWCDGDYVSDLSCGLYGGGQEFTLTPKGGGQAIALTTGPNGTASVALPAGQWELDEVGAEWCLAESDGANAAGYLVVRDGYETVVTVYNCGDGGPVGTPLPTKLPDTGSGDAADGPKTAGPTGPTEILGFLLAAAVLVLATRSKRSTRRRRAEGPPAA
jgi:hypothetical protein